MKKQLLAIGFTAATAISMNASAESNRDYISVVGSSTVYPFSTVVAERFGRSSNFKTPKVESTGSGGGLKLFCAGLGDNTPDITNASRAIKSSEIELCSKNGITDIIEVKIGYDGIVLANAKSAAVYDFTLKDIYLGLARHVPNPDGSETLVENPYTTWKQVNKNLPDMKIEVLGPPPTSGTRDAFVELAMEGGCKKVGFIKAMKKQDKSKYKAVCHGIREDGAFIEAGENDNLIVQKLRANPSMLGIFGFSYLDQNSDMVQGSKINGVTPEFEKISSGEYPVSRSLYFYVKKQHMAKIAGIQEFLNEFVSEKAMGEEGYLVDKGMIPLNAKAYKAVVKTVKTGKTL